MEVGIITRSICRAVLKFVGTMVSNLHHSFGDSQDNPDYELPHLVAPLFSGMDRVVVTPPGQTPPPLGSPFIEDIEFRKARLKSKSLFEFPLKLECTYSLSVYAGNLDLPNWQMTGVPMVGAQDLRSFFGDATIRMGGYEVPFSVAKEFPDSHPQSKINYVFAIKVSII